MKTLALAMLLLVGCAKPSPAPPPFAGFYGPEPPGYTPGGGHTGRIPECVVRC